MQTIERNPAWWASTTAGWSSAAAVPLVTQIDGGSTGRHGKPSAKKPALRSSRRTWVRRRSARATASGVDRDPGQITASVTPSRAHSSTRVALNVACTLTRRGTQCRGARLGAAAGGAARVHPDRSALGSLRRDLAGSHARRRGPSRPRRIRRRARRSADDRCAGGRDGPDDLGDEPCDLLGYSLGARVALHVVSDGPGPAPCGLHRRRPRAWRDRRCVHVGAGRRGESPTDSRPRVTSRASRGTGCAARCSSGCPPRRPTEAERLRNTRRGVSRRASACAGRAPRSRCGIASRRSAGRSSPWRDRTTPACAHTPSGSARQAPQAVASLVPGGGHAVHLSQPEQTLADRPALARDRRRC